MESMEHGMAQLILDSLPSPVLMSDLHGRLIFVNRAVEDDLGVERGELLGRPLIEALYQGRKFDRRGKYRSALMETLETGRSFNARFMEVKTVFHQLPRFFLVDTFFVHSSGGQLLGACAVYHDIFRHRELLKRAVMSRLTTISEQFETIYAFAEAIGARDLYTMGHSEKVAEYARLIAEALGLQEKEVDLAYICGIVHDVGKIGVPENILNKPGPLLPEEFVQITCHPDKGAAILSHISWLEQVVPVVLAHHERYDGRGYPRGLKGEEIPLLSRILSVADAFDAMTSDRSYRRALPVPVAINELKRNAGTQFDPRIVEVFVQVLLEYQF
ncbi:MAG TPA: HD domain-containing protein [Desulfotomaculum sp.]|nr:HD domain-containing protein [Desulfotomaculum sp.]